MKTKIKRHSRSVLSIVLTLCMLVSCMTVGIIATDAAKITGSSEAIGAKVDADSSVGNNEFYHNYLYVDLSSLSTRSLNLVRMYDEYGCSTYKGQVNLNNSGGITNLGNSIYKVDLSKGDYSSYVYSRGFEIETNVGSTYYNYKLGVVNGQKENCAKIDSSGNFSWTNYFPDYTLHLNYGDNGGWQTKTFDTNGAAYIDLSGTTSYEFYIQDSYNNYYKNTGTITSSTSFSTPWTMDGQSNCWINANGDGPYKFTIDENSDKIRLKVDYPSAVKIYGEVDSGSWSNTGLPMTYEGNGLYSYSGSYKPISADVLYRFTVGTKYYSYNSDGTADGNVSTDSSNPSTAKQHDNEPNNRAFKFAPQGSEWTVYVDVTSSSNKLTYATIDAPAYFIVGSSGLVGTATDWSVNDEKGRMTYSGNHSYTKTFNNVAAGTFSFRITSPATSGDYVTNSTNTSVSGNANPSLSGNNVTFTTSEAHSVTITFSDEPVSGSYQITVSLGTPVADPWNGEKPDDTTSDTSYHISYGVSDDTWRTLRSGNAIDSGLDVQYKDNAWYADLTSLLDTWSQASGNYVGLALTHNGTTITYVYPGNKVDINNPVVEGSSSLVVFKTDDNNNQNDTKYYFTGIQRSTLEDITSLGLKVYYVGGKLTYKFYVNSSAVSLPTIDIYAKNGTLRDSTFNRFTNLADTTFDQTYFEYSEVLNGEVVTYSGAEGITAYNTNHSTKQIAFSAPTGYNSDYEVMTNVPVGAKIKLKTTLSDNATKAGSFDSKAFMDTHYLKAYSFNGMTYELHEANTTGVYEEIWTVSAVNTQYKNNDVLADAMKDGKAVEVTPIYYMKDNSNCKTFYIDGYDGEVQNAWGNMLAVYPYYEGKSNSANAFGGYPGQPMLFWGGKYQMEIPLTVDGTASGASVKGLTLHNGYWDLLHRSLDIRCNARNHAQTYDYDDFYKLYKEKNPDTIIFDYKYRTTINNYNDGYNYTNYTFGGTSADASTYAASDHNGVELLTDYFGRQVDVFGNLIVSNQSTYDTTPTQTKELLIVSNGYKDTYVGEYATLWAVYAPQSSIPTTTSDGDTQDTAGKFIGYISSSMLYLNNWDRRLQYTGGDSTAKGRMSWTEFEKTYNWLKKYYNGVPALISYEEEIWNDSKDKANRSDGRWYYSNKGDKISASIKIQYGSYTLLDAPDHSVSSDAWVDDDFDATKTGVGGYKNIGATTGCSAYFTNTTPNIKGKVDSGEQFADNDKSFTFQADTAGSWMFAGWVRYSNGKYYEITQKELGESPMSANDVYIARFVDAQTGSLTVQHVVEQNDTYTGEGTASVTVTVKDGATTKFTKTVADGSKIDISQWIDAHFAAYTIDISLSTDPDDTSESFMKEIVSSSGNYGASPATFNAGVTPDSGAPDKATKTATVAQFTVQDVLDSGVTGLRYVSHLMKPHYTYQYEIVYTYYSRFWGSQSYTQTGTFETDSDFAANTTGAKNTAKLTTDFIIDKTPYEKNFRQQINWNYTNSAVASAGGTNDHGAAAMENNFATAVAGQDNTYKMTAHVYASNTVNDRVTAEFILPYNYDTQANGYVAKQTNVYASANATTPSSQTYLRDTGYESVTLNTQAYKLFTYDGGDIAGGDDQLISSTHLMEAAPYLMVQGTGTQQLNYHYAPSESKRYYTGNSFTVNDVTYYLNELPEGVSEDATHKVINSSNVDSNYTVKFTKRKNASIQKETTYKYAVASGTPGTVGYQVYYFAYAMNDDETPALVDGKFVFNGQYIVFTETDVQDGVIANTGVKKYFTRWDIYNTKGDYVASCYNRKFNYSGYDNYIVRPVYESDEEQSYASSSGVVDSTSASITYLGDTRNQWNNGAQGEYQNVTKKTDGTTAGDKLIHDFALAFAYNGEEIQKIDSTNHTIKIGMVIEQVSALDKIGSSVIYDPFYYSEKEKGTINAAYISNIAGAVGAGTSKALKDATGKTSINSKIGANVDGWGTRFGTSTTTALSFDSVIDNFNRLQWFYTFSNTKDGSGNLRNANYAYRAWAYIIVDGVATVSDTPAYFTLYDSAHR